MSSVLHHVEFCVGEERNLIDLLIRGLGFRPIARHFTPLSSKWALKHGSSVFVVTKRRKKHDHQNGVTEESNDYLDQGRKYIKEQSHLSSEISSINDHSNDVEHWTVFCCQDQATHTIDSAFNIALVVRDVDEVTKRVKAHGGRVLREPTVVKDSHGQVKYSIVTSCFGNVVHTLINKQDYFGEFLPRFQRLEFDEYESNFLKSKEGVTKWPSNDLSSYAKDKISISEFLQEAKINYSNFWINNGLNGDPLFTHVDHVAFACESGQSKELMAWYEQCFGMKRFITNRKESEDDGFVLEESIGLRIKAMEYWRCAEIGLTVPVDTHGDSVLKMVIAEPLKGFRNSQIDTFLHNHKGPGVQHIALHTPNMAPAVKHVSQRGISFRKAPPVYYQKDLKLDDIKAAGHEHEIDLFQQLGILVDTEDDVFTGIAEQKGKKKYLLQVFTTPIFQEETFFLEVIHREGAEGFGAGNIRALAQSILYDKKQKAEAKTCNVSVQ